jgi:phosphatidylserine/phosphatidylglycerophosphate/cardiolipin synthase-like enzyme
MQDRIIELIEAAEQSIDIGMTILDSKEISNTLIKQAKNGVKVRVIVDRLTADLENSSYQYLLEKINSNQLSEEFELKLGGKANVTDAGEYSIFHHHNMIIDQKTVLTGTANWTFNGFFVSDENFLIIENTALAKKFTSFFESNLQTI